MAVVEDIRYEPVRSLSRQEAREAWVARDVWTARTVILKTDRCDLMRREASILLALPTGIGPRVHDVVWKGAGRLLIALEHLQGSTLADRAATLAPEHVPSVLRAFAQSLAHLHRAGFTHADLSPRNLFILDSPGEPDVRLLDFGFARRRAAGPGTPSGGTPPFVAPELVRGWMVDERADQYSLGMIVRESFPDLVRDARWAPIVDRLCHRRPGHRYPHMIAVREALETAFPLPPSPFRWPPFGGGPLRGRSALLAEVGLLLRSPNPARVLLLSRRGLGLSRFLAEAALMAAAGDCPPLRVIDVGDLLAEGSDGQELAGHLEDQFSAWGGEALLSGLPDPSTRLRWLPPGQAEGLRAAFARPGWVQLDLPPLDAAAFTELVAGSLESGGDLSEPLASRLLQESDGDLRCSAELFRAQVQHYGSESGPYWVVDPARVRHASQRGSPPAPKAALPSLSHAELTALRVLARAGRTFPRALAEPLLARFADPSVLEDLLAGAVLVAQGPERLEFITRSLWRHVLCPVAADTSPVTGASLEAGAPSAPGALLEASASPDADNIDGWLNDHTRPDPDDPEAILFAAQRARRLGDSRREAALLASALAWAQSTRTWGHVGALLAHPDDPPLQWSREQTLRQLSDLGTLLGPPWSTGRLTLLAANALHFADPRTSSELLDVAAAARDPLARSGALVALAERAHWGRDWTAFAQHLGDLERLASEGMDSSLGVVEHLRGSAARARGDPEEAVRHLERAADLLRGTGSPYEVSSLQLLGVLRFARDPAAGIRRLNEALAAGPGPELEAQLRANLSIMYSQAGNEEASARCVEEGLQRLRGRASAMRLVNLRLQLAWSWAETDEVDKALREGRAMLDTSAVRASLFLRTGTRMLIGFCHLHQGNMRSALSESARAWRDRLEGGLTVDVSACLEQLIDVLLDCEAWDVAGEFGDDLLRAPEAATPLDPRTLARLQALRAQIEGRPPVALDHLAGRLEEGRLGADSAAAARYLHHIGLVQLACGNGSGAAIQFFEDEVSLLGERGRTYFRGRAQYCLAHARAAARQFDRAFAALDGAEALARQGACKGLLAEVLAARLQFGEDNGTH
jgi:tetratricopeptide (TPR) repeat protein